MLSVTVSIFCGVRDAGGFWYGPRDVLILVGCVVAEKALQRVVAPGPCDHVFFVYRGIACLVGKGPTSFIRDRASGAREQVLSQRIADSRRVPSLKPQPNSPMGPACAGSGFPEAATFEERVLRMACLSERVARCRGRCVRYLRGP